MVSEHTVKTHVGNVFLKLGLRDRIHAVIYAYEHGVVRPAELGLDGQLVTSGSCSSVTQRSLSCGQSR